MIVIFHCLYYAFVIYLSMNIYFCIVAVWLWCSEHWCRNLYLNPWFQLFCVYFVSICIIQYIFWIIWQFYVYLVEEPKNCFHSSCTFYIPTKLVRVSASPYACQYLFISLLCNGYPDGCKVRYLMWFWFAFPSWLMKLNLFSWAYQPFGYLWRMSIQVLVLFLNFSLFLIRKVHVCAWERARTLSCLPKTQRGRKSIRTTGLGCTTILVLVLHLIRILNTFMSDMLLLGLGFEPHWACGI